VLQNSAKSRKKPHISDHQTLAHEYARLDYWQSLPERVGSSV
jgi:hypothetical protein